MSLDDIRSPANADDMRSLLSEIRGLVEAGTMQGCIVGPGEISMRMGQSERWVRYWPLDDEAKELLEEFLTELGEA